MHGSSHEISFVAIDLTDYVHSPARLDPNYESTFTQRCGLSFMDLYVSGSHLNEPSLSSFTVLAPIR